MRIYPFPSENGSVLCELDQVRLTVVFVWTWSGEINSGVCVNLTRWDWQCDIFVWTWPGEIDSVMFVWTWPSETNSVLFVWTWPAEIDSVLFV